MTRRVRFVRSLPAIVTLALLGACAPRAPELPPPGPPRYPDFLFPAFPADLGTPVVHERHRTAWMWLQAGDLRAAERNFASSLKLAPDFYPAEAGLAYVALAREDHRSAVGHFERAVGSNPRYVPALVGRGEALLALGDRGMALKSFEAAVASDPSLSGLRSRIDVLRFRGLQEDVAAARQFAEAGRLPEARSAYAQAITASPESPFLHRELALVERRAGDFEAALRHAERARELEPTEVRNVVLIGELQEARGDIETAAETYEAALSLEHNDALADRLGDIRERLLIASMPPEFQTIETSPTISRAQLAALLGVRLDDLLDRMPQRTAVVITDTRGNWASVWILRVARAGVMEVYPNHTFQPATLVRRGDLAMAASRVLSLIAAEKPALGESWRNARRRFPDVSPGHLTYPAASLVVEAGVMEPLDGGSFQLTRPVSGAEAAAAVRKLEELAASSGR